MSKYNYSMKLSPHFTLGEFSIHAKQMPAISIPFLEKNLDSKMIEALTHTAENMEEVRRLLGNNTIEVNCVLRSIEWEHYKGRRGDSRHCFGEAVDFTCWKYGDPYKVAKKIADNVKDIDFDQLIWEFNSWVHISWRQDGKPNRREIWTCNSKGVYKKGLVK